MGDNIRKYKVDKKVEIDSYDWSYLNQTNDNRITSITCSREPAFQKVSCTSSRVRRKKCKKYVL